MTRGPHTPDGAVVLTCGDDTRWRAAARAVGEIVPVTAVPARDEVDPVLGRVGRLVVAGSDAALAAVLVRLLRRERLDVAVAFLPAPGSEAARVWGLPSGSDELLALARSGTAHPVPLVRDDRGGAVAGVHRVAGFTGEAYCDEHLMARGSGTTLEVRPDPERHGVAVTVIGPRRLGGLRPGRRAQRHGRAVQIGCLPAVVEREGVPGDRPVERRSWYPHLEDWRLVRPLPADQGRA